MEKIMLVGFVVNICILLYCFVPILFPGITKYKRTKNWCWRNAIGVYYHRCPVCSEVLSSPYSGLFQDYVCDKGHYELSFDDFVGFKVNIDGKELLFKTASEFQDFLMDYKEKSSQLSQVS